MANDGNTEDAALVGPAPRRRRYQAYCGRQLYQARGLFIVALITFGVLALAPQAYEFYRHRSLALDPLGQAANLQSRLMAMIARALGLWLRALSLIYGESQPRRILATTCAAQPFLGIA